MSEWTTEHSDAAADKESIIVEFELPHVPGKVWRALTDPELLAAWLMPNNIRAEVGCRFSFQMQTAPGWNGTIECEVLDVEPHRRLAYSWTAGSQAVDGNGRELATVVTWTLTPTADGGTRLNLHHSGFDADSFAYKTMGQGWSGKVSNRLRDVLAKGYAHESDAATFIDSSNKGKQAMPTIERVVTLTIAVADQDAALAWFTEKLGFQKRADMQAPGMRWLTVAPALQTEVEFLLATWFPDRVGKNPTCVVSTQDCQNAYEELSAKGVEFTQKPEQRSYGTEAVFMDLYGNKYAMVQGR